jgi:hypothetical protein
MVKNTVRFLALALTLVIATAAAAGAAAGETCTREVGWTDGNGHPLDCYTCGAGSQQTTYCYPSQ